MIGQTGSGKTVLSKEILKSPRRFRLALMAKPDDLSWYSWKTISSAKHIGVGHGDEEARLRLLPPVERMAEEFPAAMRAAWQQGGWCVYVDELYYLEDLGCRDLLRQLLTQGRSKAISVVCGCQRPAHVTRYALSETTHVFSGVLGDSRDIKTVRDYIGEDYAARLPGLEWHQFLYYNKRSRTMKIVTRDNVQEALSVV